MNIELSKEDVETIADALDYMAEDMDYRQTKTGDYDEGSMDTLIARLNAVAEKVRS